MSRVGDHATKETDTTIFYFKFIFLCGSSNFILSIPVILVTHNVKFSLDNYYIEQQRIFFIIYFFLVPIYVVNNVKTFVSLGVCAFTRYLMLYLFAIHHTNTGFYSKQNRLYNLG